MAFKWETFFETGITIVDQQHRVLVEIINEAAPLLSARGALTRGRLEILIDRLFDYAAIHFKTEEGVMRANGLLDDYCAEHQNIHRSFVNQLVEQRVLMESSIDDDAGSSLLRFLTGWLTFHILNEDQRMARQIRLVQSGQTPEMARKSVSEIDPDDKARAALVAALLDLYAVVGERNRSLIATNAQLKSVSRELELTNAALEQRVLDRTGELQEALTNMERTQSQLLQSEKMAAIGQLAAGVAHEINNPVGFVTSNVGSLKKYVQQLLVVIDAYDEVREAIPPTDPRRQHADLVRAAADLDFLRKDVVELIEESESGLLRVRKIVQDLKDFSHVDESEWQDSDINAGLESTLNVVWSEIKYKAEVVKHFGDLPKVHCVAAQINQVFMNLLVNAAQSIETQGVITLTTGIDDAGVWIEIADTGKGMSAEIQQRIFEPFYTTKPVGKGTGLGLSISWDVVVKKHGGSLNVKSAPGKGSTFRIGLPLNGKPLMQLD